MINLVIIFLLSQKKKKKKSGVIRHYDSPSMVEIATNYVIIEKI